MDRNLAWREITRVVMGVTVVAGLMLGLSISATPATPSVVSAASLCGDGSAPDYGFTYALQQAHWTVGWQSYASEKAVTEVDTILDRLNADAIAQTMILIQPAAQVGNRVNCAVHFLRYMELGLPTGERKDNGFVFLIVVEPTRLDVHYGVGLGLPALTAPELTTLNRTAEAAYQTTRSLDQALLTLVQGFDTVARNKYAPLITSAPTPETVKLPPQAAAGPLGVLASCGLPCLGLFFLLFMAWMLSQLSRRGITFLPTGSGSFGAGSPFGGGGGGGRGSSPTRGGGGSGRAGRGN